MSQNVIDSHSTDHALEEWVDVPENSTIPHHLIKSLFDTDLHILHQSCVALHNLLDERFPPILPMVEAGLVPRLLEMLEGPTSVPIQREVVWVLARLASGPPEPVHIMVSRGAVPKLTNIMASSSCEEVRDTAAWALGNILGHPSIVHKLPLQGGFGSYRLLRGAYSKTFFRSLSWAYDHLKPYMLVPFRTFHPLVEAASSTFELGVQLSGLYNVCLVAVTKQNHLTSSTPSFHILAKRAGMTEERSKGPIVEPSGITIQGLSEIQASLTQDGKIPEGLILGFHSNDPQTRKTAVTNIRRILQLPGPHAIQPVIDTGLVLALVSLLDSEDTSLQCDAAWIVTNIACGTTEQKGLLVEAGAIPKLVRLSASPNDYASFNAILALSNIVGDSPGLRDRVEDKGGIDALARLLNDTETSPKVQGVAVGAISDYLNPWPFHRPSVMKVTFLANVFLESKSDQLNGLFTQIKHLVPCLTRQVQQSHLDEATTEVDKESIACAIKSLSYILYHGLKRSKFIETGLVPRLVHLVANSLSSANIQKRALWCTGSLVNGDDHDADAAVDAGLVPALLVPLEATDEEVCKLALWNASNIAAGSQSQVYALLDCGLLKPIVSGDVKVGQAFLESGGIEGLAAGLLILDRKAKEIPVSGIPKFWNGKTPSHMDLKSESAFQQPFEVLRGHGTSG
ncbi:hypothetical protein FS837_009295 [Tulasnella sp. UAMH 9824]|nr:hypothetical protein FS837_009295 [Tulasnella sp. UAMH 9824]